MMTFLVEQTNNKTVIPTAGVEHGSSNSLLDRWYRMPETAGHHPTAKLGCRASRAISLFLSELLWSDPLTVLFPW